MGNASSQEAFVLGDFILRNETAVLPCSFSTASKLQLILQDGLGRTTKTRDFDVDANTTELVLDLEDCNAGTYHAWIYIEDKVFVKPFSIDNPMDKGLLDKLLGIFKK